LLKGCWSADQLQGVLRCCAQSARQSPLLELAVPGLQQLSKAGLEGLHGRLLADAGNRMVVSDFLNVTEDFLFLAVQGL
jgi:hypothetical protein